MMSRITQRHADGTWSCPGGFTETNYGAACKLKDYEDTGLSPDEVLRMKEKLEEYEDAGLVPEKIRDMDKLYLEKCKEVNTLKAQLGALQPEPVKIMPFMPDRTVYDRMRSRQQERYGYQNQEVAPVQPDIQEACHAD